MTAVTAAAAAAAGFRLRRRVYATGSSRLCLDHNAPGWRPGVDFCKPAVDADRLTLGWRILFAAAPIVVECSPDQASDSNLLIPAKAVV